MATSDVFNPMNHFTEHTARARAEVAQFFPGCARSRSARKFCARERYARVIVGLQSTEQHGKTRTETMASRI